MSVTYDLTTPIGQVRLLAFDTNIAGEVIFQDEEITALLGLNSQDVRLAAAQGVDVIASNESYVQKVIDILDAKTNGPAVAKDLRVYAAELREQVATGYGDFTGMFDYAEQVFDAFSARMRAINEWERSSGP